MDRDTISRAVGAAWAHPKNRHKVMDPDLALAIVDNICIMLQKAKIESLERMMSHGHNSNLQRTLDLAKSKLAIMETAGTEVTVDDAEPQPDHVQDVRGSGRL